MGLNVHYDWWGVWVFKIIIIIILKREPLVFILLFCGGSLGGVLNFVFSISKLINFSCSTYFSNSRRFKLDSKIGLKIHEHIRLHSVVMLDIARLQIFFNKLKLGYCIDIMEFKN